MKLKIIQFETGETSKSYKIVNQEGTLVGLFSGLSNEENLENAILFKNATEVFDILEKVISKMRLTNSNEIALYKKAKKIIAQKDSLFVNTK